MNTTRELRWSWQGKEITVGLDEAGSGPLVVLLPALSSNPKRLSASMRSQSLG